MSRSMKTGHLRDHALPLCAALMLASAAAAALSSCFFDTKTTLCEASGLRCKPGQTCAATEAACVDIGGCGDGVTSGDEVCDDGNVSDGDDCSANCLSDESCGNGVVDTAVDEPCDYSVPNSYNCSSECKIQQCGNFTLDPGEECDSGAVDSLGCDFNCKIPVCRDGHHNTLAEKCEPKDGVDQPDCDADCTLPVCGDQYTNSSISSITNAPLESCDLGGDKPTCNGYRMGSTGSCQFPKCGDGYRNQMYRPSGPSGPTEGCDDGRNSDLCNGNDHDKDGIDDNAQGETVSPANCQLTKCGDSYINPAAMEQCDDGNSDNSDGCPTGIGGTCEPATCGDGFRRTTPDNQKEECDYSASNPNQPCTRSGEVCDETCHCNPPPPTPP